MARQKKNESVSNRPRPLQDEPDHGSETDSETTSTSFEEAWRTIQRAEGCTEQKAKGLAMDRFPELYEEFLESQRHPKSS